MKSRTPATHTAMVLTESTELAHGTPAADFSLLDPLSGEQVSLQRYAGSPLLILFMCNHCPYVVHIVDALVASAERLAKRGVATVAISANDAVAYPEDAPEAMAALAKQKGFGFPYLYDESQAVARAYGAVCTPDPYVFDAQHQLFYRGQFDSSRPGQGTATGADVDAAVEDLLAGRERPQRQQPSVGCSIKWRR